MASIYIETSIVSFLRQRPNSQVVNAARQILSQRWWDTERQNYELYTSQYVLNEAAKGNPALARERLLNLDKITLLKLHPIIDIIADELVSFSALPTKARIDASHIAVAAYHRVDYLLTWNCSHIANARIQPRVREVLARHGLATPVICTPQGLLDEEN